MGAGLGEVMDLGTGFGGGGLSLISSLVGLIALGIFALLQNDRSPVHFPTKREVAQFLASQASAFAKSHE